MKILNKSNKLYQSYLHLTVLTFDAYLLEVSAAQLGRVTVLGRGLHRGLSGEGQALGCGVV